MHDTTAHPAELTATTATHLPDETESRGSHPAGLTARLSLSSH